MRKFSAFLTVFLALCFISSAAWAHPFINPPEIFAPGWQTPFTYQRNIYWDFSVNPVGGPPGPLPGAVYEGWADPMLWESDYVYFEGDVVWNGGAIGLEGSAGYPSSGDAVFHLDNFIEQNPVKHVYLEATVINSVSLQFPGDSIAAETNWGPPTLVLPTGYYEDESYWGYMWTDLGGEMWLLDMWFKIGPNPPWEDIILPFYVPEGEYVWIDDLHIATECVGAVPIPGALWLLGSGLIGLVGLRRKIKS